MVPVERVVTRTEYIPVERKIVHYPQTSLGAEVQTRIDAGLVTGATTFTRGATVVGGPVIGGSLVGGQVVGGQIIGGSAVGGYTGALAGSTYATGPAVVQGSNYRTQTVTTTQGPIVGGTTVVGGPIVGGANIVGGQVIGGSTIGGSLVGGATRGTYVTGPTYTTTEYTSAPVAYE
jgi:hypothetical protein